MRIHRYFTIKTQFWKNTNPNTKDNSAETHTYSVDFGFWSQRKQAQNEPPGASFGLFPGLGPKRLKISLLGPVLACSRAWARKGSK